MSNYCIKEDYISRTTYHHHDDRTFTDGSQNDVYLTAFELVKNKGFKNIIDIGCGSGFKLIKYFDDHNTVGYEIEPTLSFLNEKYPHKQWKQSDFNDLSKIETDVIICSDVIEHLLDPDELMKFISNIDFKYLVISTPDRDELEQVHNDPNKQNQKGPPINPGHVREWNFSEFEEYIGKFFKIESHTHQKGEFWGQIVIACKI